MYPYNIRIGFTFLDRLLDEELRVQNYAQGRISEIEIG